MGIKLSEKEKEERKIIKIKKPLPPEPLRITKPEGEVTSREIGLEVKKTPPPEPWRITKPEREPHREIKKAPPPEPTRKIKPKEEKKE